MFTFLFHNKSIKCFYFMFPWASLSTIHSSIFLERICKGSPLPRTPIMAAMSLTYEDKDISSESSIHFFSSTDLFITSGKNSIRIFDIRIEHESFILGGSLPRTYNILINIFTRSSVGKLLNCEVVSSYKTKYKYKIIQKFDWGNFMKHNFWDQ